MLTSLIYLFNIILFNKLIIPYSEEEFLVFPIFNERIVLFIPRVANILCMIPSFRTHHLLQALHAFEEQDLPLDVFLNNYYRTHKAIGSKDRAFLNETIYALIRWKGLLDAYEYPPYSWEKRFETLQKHSLDILRSKDTLKAQDKVSFPEWLYFRLKEQYGEATANQICLVSNTEAPPTIRVNRIKSNREMLLEALQKYDHAIPTKLSPYGIVFSKRLNYFEIPEFNAGHFEIQDEGSQLLADLVNPKENDQVLDFCAGSGGKTLAFAHKMQGKGQIYLHDIRKKALQQAKKRLKKAGIQNAQILLPDSANLKKLKGKMQWVLVDAPCSGTGTLRRNPDMKWKLNEEMIQRWVGMQRTIFEQALSYLAPKGSIVYGTCSLLDSENEKQIEHFIKIYHLKIIGAPLTILPQAGGSDGFYGAVLQRNEAL